MTKTLLAFDFGTYSIGCAVRQSITGTAQGLPAFKAQDGIPNWAQIEKSDCRMATGFISGWLTTEYGWN